MLEKFNLASGTHVGTQTAEAFGTKRPYDDSSRGHHQSSIN